MSHTDLDLPTYTAATLPRAQDAENKLVIYIAPDGSRELRFSDGATWVFQSSSVSGGGTYVPPSGDLTGATDTAAVNAYTTTGVHVRLGEGDYYFNDTVRRGFLRNPDGTLVHNSIGGGFGTTMAILGDLVGAGVDKTRLHFLNTSKPGIEFWERTVQDDGVTPYRSHVGIAGTDYPTQWSGGKTGGFELMGSFPVAPTLLGSVDDAVTVVLGGATYPKYANHIGILAWGSGDSHHFFDIKTTRFGVGRVLHDMTLSRIDRCPIAECDIGEAHAIQWDLNYYSGCQTRDCRFGTMMEWSGLLKAAGGWVKFPRESVGVVVAGITGTGGQANSYYACAWTGHKFAALAGAEVDNNTANGRMWSNQFRSCYWENNASEYYLIRNATQGQHNFRNCNIFSTNYVNARALRTNSALQAKLGVSQTTVNNSFGLFWGFSTASADTSFHFEDVTIDPSPYGYFSRLGNGQLHWKNNYINASTNGNAIQPATAPAGEDATILTIMGYRGVALSAGAWWPVDNATKSNIEPCAYRDIYIENGYSHDRNGLPKRIDTATALPTASVLYRGQTRILTGANGAADVVQICVKDAADAYSWKTITVA